MIQKKKYFRIFEKKLPIGKVKRTLLSRYEYFSMLFSFIFQSPDYSTILAHFHNNDKSVLASHGLLSNNLILEAIPGRWLKLPPHNLTFITGPVVIIYGKINPFDILKELETNSSLSEIRDSISPYLVIHNKKLLPLADLVNYQNIVNALEKEYNTNIGTVFKMMNYLLNDNKTKNFFVYTTFFQDLLSLLKKKILTNGNTNSIRT